MLMTRIGAPFALVDGNLCHLYTLNVAQAYLAGSLRELTEPSFWLFKPGQVSLPRTSIPNAWGVRTTSKI